MAPQLKELVKTLQDTQSTDQEKKDVLIILKKDITPTITESLIRESKAGLAVGKLRQHSNRDVAELAKEIVKAWKTAVEDAKKGGKSPATPSSASKPKPPPLRKDSTASISSIGPATPTVGSRTPTGFGKNGPPGNVVRTAKVDGVSMDQTGDKTRDRCAELIYDALASDSNAPSDLIQKRAQGIEAAVLAEYKSTNAEYKQKMRTFFVNLKDKSNPGLREALISGDLSVSKFAKMSSADMASEERKAADSKIREENLFQSLGAKEQQAETDAFQCSRCKQRKCRYRQAQTRSADEPMTTFVTCTVCNNHWKFS